jgi:hypothetical protein
MESKNCCGSANFVRDPTIAPGERADPSFGLSTGHHLGKLRLFPTVLLGQVLGNAASVPGVTPVAQRVRWPQFAPYVNNGFDEDMSWYHGLILKLEKRLSQNLSFSVNYTWSKTLDQSDSLGNGNIYGQPTANPTRFNINMFKGPAGFDIRQRLSASYAYDVPSSTHNRLLDAAVAHWQLSGIVTADSGVPYYVYLTTDHENIGMAAAGSPRHTEFPNLVCDPDANAQRTLAAWFNTSCFQLSPFGTRDNAGRHAQYSQGLLNWDASASKQRPLTENNQRSDLSSPGHSLRFRGFWKGDEHHAPAGAADPVRGNWDYITFDSQMHRLYVSHETEVAVLDSDGGKLVGVVAIRPACTAPP